MTRTYELPLPKFAIGTKLDPKRLGSAFSRAQLTRQLVAETMKTLRKLRKQGYADRAKDGGKMLGDHNKNRIRTMIRIMDEAASAEIIGIRPSRYGHIVGTFAHESYLEDGQSHGGVIYNYQVLYRATIDGNAIAFAPDGAYHSEHTIEGALLDYPAAPADDFAFAAISPKDLEDGTWFLQLAPATEFVSYWYGTPEDYYNKPVHLRMNHAHLDTADLFQLPERPVAGAPAVELDRAVLCGWQFATKGHGGLGWKVARNPREAVEQAKAWARRQDRRSHHDEPKLGAAIERIAIRKPWKETMDEMIRAHVASKQARPGEQ